MLVVLCALWLQASLGSREATAQVVVVKPRIALVIGNSQYDSVESLANPVNDSAAIRDRLSAFGFKLYGGDNLTRDAFEKVLSDFVAASKSAETVLVYYSGHGFQLNGRNYLVPRDAMLKSVGAIESETIRLDKIVSQLQSDDRQTLIFLDACRNNPLPPSQRQNSGLAQIEANSRNLYVAFATQPGNISYDGQYELSPFTRAITQEIGKPGQSLPDMMLNVRNEVERRTLRQQTPWEQTSLTKQFYFNATNEPVGNSTVAALDLSGAGEDAATPGRSSGIDEMIKKELAPQQPGVLHVPGDGLSNVILLPEAPIELFGDENLILSMQTELKRVGCYLGEPDGVWGQTSAEALSRYFGAKKLSDAKVDPTNDDLIILKRELGRVCKAPKVYAAPPSRTYAPARKRQGSAQRGGGQPAARQAGPSKPAAPPPRQIENIQALGAFR